MNISGMSRPQTAPRLENFQLEVSPRVRGDYRPKSHREINRPLRHRSPVAQSFRYAVVAGPHRTAKTNSSNLMIGSKSLRQMPHNASPQERIRSPSPNGFRDLQTDDPAPQSGQFETNGIHPPRDIDNQTFHDSRKAIFEQASDRDRAALKLGRLILSTVLSKPEISVADSISRFFTDVWLSKSGTQSTLETTNVTSIDLLAHLHLAMTVHDPGSDASVTQLATSQKSIAAVACEALDALIVAFGKANPILTDIRGALLPVIFMTPPESINTDLDPKFLTGKSYINLPSWCEDTATLIEEMQNTQRDLIAARDDSLRAEKERDHFKQLYENLTQEYGMVEGKILSTTREQERLRDLYRNLKRSNKTLTEEHSSLVASYEADKEQHSRDKKSNSQLTIRLEELKDKYATLAAEKAKGDQLTTRQQKQITGLSEEVTKLQDQLILAKEEITSISKLSLQYYKDFQEANNYRLDQNTKYEEAIERIEKAISSPTVNFTMGNKVLNLIRSPQRNVIEILECWNIELLERNSALEVELAATDVNQIVAAALQLQGELHEEKLSTTSKAHQLALDALKKLKDNEINQLRVVIDQVRNELFETQIDRNRTDDLLKVLEAELRESELKFDAKKRELEKRMEFSTTTKVRFQDRADMLAEDNMFETLLREQLAQNLKHEQEVAQLVTESTVLTSKLFDVEENLEIANDRLAHKISELSNAQANSMEMAADVAKMKERIEFLSRPNKREQVLEETVLQLQSELRHQEATIADLKSVSTKNQQSQQQLDRIGMRDEDRVSGLINSYESRLESARGQARRSEIRAQNLQKIVEGLEPLRGIIQNCEMQLMGYEDQLVKTSNLMLRVHRAQRVSLPLPHASHTFSPSSPLPPRAFILTMTNRRGSILTSASWTKKRMS
jgi:hypothetical protein